MPHSVANLFAAQDARALAIWRTGLHVVRNFPETHITRAQIIENCRMAVRPCLLSSFVTL